MRAWIWRPDIKCFHPLKDCSHRPQRWPGLAWLCDRQKRGKKSTVGKNPTVDWAGAHVRLSGPALWSHDASQWRDAPSVAILPVCASLYHHFMGTFSVYCLIFGSDLELVTCGSFFLSFYLYLYSQLHRFLYLRTTTLVSSTAPCNIWHHIGYVSLDADMLPGYMAYSL